MGEGTGSEEPGVLSAGSPTEVFCDSNILINYLNREWEGSQGVRLIESDAAWIIISEHVEEEVTTLVDRRLNLYSDFLQYLLEQQGDIEEYTPDDGIWGNDRNNLQTLQMALGNKDPAEALTRLREFVMRYRGEADKLFEEYVHGVVYTAPPFPLELQLGRVIPNQADAQIIAEAADWTSQGGNGIVATNDVRDLVELQDEIMQVITEHLGDDCRLYIIRPQDFKYE